MSEINKIFKTVFVLIFIFSAQAESKILSIGSPDAKVTVKVFSSLTCPHCATFHNSIFNKLKKEYIDEGLVRFEHHAFPLDLAALNAEVVIRCQTDNEKKFKLFSAALNLNSASCLLTCKPDIPAASSRIALLSVGFAVTNAPIRPWLIIEGECAPVDKSAKNI